MNEHDYIVVSNLAKVRAARDILRSTMEGPRLGITDKEAQLIKDILYHVEERLTEMVDQMMEDEETDPAAIITAMVKEQLTGPGGILEDPHAPTP